MNNHEYWQFSFVRELGPNTKSIIRLCSNGPLKVELSNLPSGSVYDQNFSTQQVSGDHLRIHYVLPSDVPGTTLTGRVKILKKPKEFPRNYADAEATTVVNEDYSSIIGDVSKRDKYYFFVDHETSGNREIWYYTAFYEATDVNSNTYWAFSPIYGFGRGFALTADTSEHGDRLFSYFSRGIRMKDKEVGNDALYNICQILGRSFDEAKARLDQFSAKRALPQEVDAAFLTYIDQMLGWPTNFELRETRRRKETVNAVDTWKSKGSTDNFEASLQLITGWDVEFEEGWRHTLTTATAEDNLDANTPPSGWVEATDGVWADIVNARPFNGTPDLSDPSKSYRPLSPNLPFRVINGPSYWTNLFGVLVDLSSPITDQNPLLRDLAKDKIDRIIDYLAIHYANFAVQISDYHTESLVFDLTDDHEDVMVYPNGGEFEITEAITHAGNIPMLYTYPHPTNTVTTSVIWENGLASPAARLFHNVLN